MGVLGLWRPGGRRRCHPSRTGTSPAARTALGTVIQMMGAQPPGGRWPREGGAGRVGAMAPVEEPQPAHTSLAATLQCAAALLRPLPARLPPH